MGALAHHCHWDLVPLGPETSCVLGKQKVGDPSLPSDQREEDGLSRLQNLQRKTWCPANQKDKARSPALCSWHSLHSLT